MYILLGLFISFIRLFSYAFADIPDILDTVPEHIASTLGNEIIRLGSGLPGIYPLDALPLLIFGGRYASPFSLPSLNLYLYSCLPFFFCCIGIQLVRYICSKWNSCSGNFYQRLGLLVVAAPSTSYNLISPKNEAFLNSIAILIVFFMIHVWHRATPYPSKFFREKQTIISISLLVLLFRWACAVFRDNQSDIITIFLIISVLFSFEKFNTLFRFPRISFAFLRLNLRFVLSVLGGLVLLLSLAEISNNQPLIYSHLSQFPGLKSISFTASQGLLADSSIADKYPFVFRPIFTLLIFVFGTASGYSVQIFTKLYVIIFLLLPFNRYSAARYSMPDYNVLMTSLLLVLFARSIFPGYSNYKYWIPLCPLILSPSALFSFKPLLIGFSLVYFELILKLLLFEFV